MNIRLIPAIVLSAIGFLHACTKVTDPSLIQDQLRARVLQDYLVPFRTGDVDEWMKVFDESVVAMHDGLPPLEGKKAVREFAVAVAGNFDIPKMELVIDEVRVSENWAWTRGRFDTVFVAKSETAPPGVAGPRQGKFLLLWQQGKDGVWRVIMDMGNGMAAGPGVNGEN